MTVQEIKEQYSMRDIVKRYGIRLTGTGFVTCPFHKGDRQPSMKIYQKDYHCYACGANGDIFNFVQQMENVSFKEAFCILGGTYGKPSFSSALAVYRSKKRQEMMQKEREKRNSKKQLNHMLICIYRAYLGQSEPFSDVWCDCYNALQYQLYIHSELYEREAWW